MCYAVLVNHNSKSRSFLGLLPSRSAFLFLGDLVLASEEEKEIAQKGMLPLLASIFLAGLPEHFLAEMIIIKDSFF